MIKSKDELLNSIKNHVGDDTSDETISFIEDITDTLNYFETKTNGDGVDWKQKYEDNDREWRAKYTERFFNPENPPEDIPAPQPEKDYNERMSFDDLFKEV